MFRLINFLLFYNYISINNAQKTQQIVYKPTSPQICRDTCVMSRGFFNFIREDLSCRQILKNDSSKQDTNASGDSSPTHEGVIQATTAFNYITNDECKADTVSTKTTLSPIKKGIIQCTNNSLSQACEKGNLAAVRNIIFQGLEDINCHGKKGRTPVITAAGHGQRAVFDFLVRQGCDLSVFDNDNGNVLHAASIGGNVDIVNKLINCKELDINVRSKNGWTPVMLAAYYCHKELFKVFVDKGCELKIENEDSNSVLHVACIGGNVDIVKYILNYSIININAKGLKARTPIMMAAIMGRREVFDVLLSAGCNFRTLDEENDNILHLACNGGHVDLVKVILSRNLSDINCKGLGMRTPVMIAALNGHSAVVDLLVKKGCNLLSVDMDKNNILHVACIGGHVHMVKYILSLNMINIDSRGFSGQTPMMEAAAFGKKKVFNFLVNEGCNLKAVDNEKNTLFHVVCNRGNVDMVKYLMTLKTVKKMMKMKNIYGRTPLQEAKGKKHVVVVRLLKGQKYKK